MKPFTLKWYLHQLYRAHTHANHGNDPYRHEKLIHFLEQRIINKYGEQ